MKDPKDSPWKTLSVKQVYDNPWINLSEAAVINPNGGKGIYGKITFKTKALGIVPLDENQNTWLVGQYRYTLGEYSWEIPMGGGPRDGDILESAKRELKEETGLIAEKWTKLMRIHTSNSVTDEEGFIFLAENLTQGEQETDPTEKLEIKKIPLAEAVKMIEQGEITDAISISGLLYAYRILKL